MNDSELEKHIEKLINLQKGDDGGELYYMEGGHYSHPVEFDVLTTEKAKALALRHERCNAAPEQLEADVTELHNIKDDISMLLYRPGNFMQGDELCLWVQRGIEYAFLSAVMQKRKELQDALVDIIYGCYQNMDSLILQDAILFALEIKGAKALVPGSKFHKILRFFYRVNDIAFQEQYDKAHYCHRVNNQKRIIRALFHYRNTTKFPRKEPVDDGPEQLYSGAKSDVTRQIVLLTSFAAQQPFHYPGHEAWNFIAEDVLNAYEKQVFSYLHECASFPEHLLEDIDLYGLPRLIGHLHIKTCCDRGDLISRLATHPHINVHYRLHALWMLARVETDPFSSEVMYDKAIEYYGGEGPPSYLKYIKIDDNFTTAAGEFFAKDVSGRLLADDDTQSSHLRLYQQAVDAETLYTAAAVKLRDKHKDVDILCFLRNVKFIFAVQGNLLLVLSGEDQKTAATYQIPLTDDGTMVSYLERFVESVYSGKTKQKFNCFGESPLAMLTIAEHTTRGNNK